MIAHIVFGLMIWLDVGLPLDLQDNPANCATKQELRLTLEVDKRECNAGAKLILDLRASNHGQRAVLLNGRLIPGEAEKVAIEPLNTPVLVCMKPKQADGRVKEIRHILRMKDVAELAADKKYAAPLFSRLDPKTKKPAPGVEVEAPSTAGTWLVSCRLIMPHPDPERADTIYVASNEVSVRVK
jgi:hypothetical protein